MHIHANKHRTIILILTAVLVLFGMPVSLTAEEMNTVTVSASPMDDTANGSMDSGETTEPVQTPEIEDTTQTDRAEETEVSLSSESLPENNAEIADADVFPADTAEIAAASEEETLLEAAGDSATATPSVLYRTHVQSYGWLEENANGDLSGTTGKSKRLEAIRIRIDGDSGLDVTYQTHVQTYGWSDWVSSGSRSGTEGESKRLEAIRIKLTGKDADVYDIYYCVHVQSYGWMDWVKNGATAGTEGQGKRMEAIRILLVPKGDPAPWYPGSPETTASRPSVHYKVHTQTYGWMQAASDGASAGTQGESKRLEAVSVFLENAPYSGSVEYRTHIQSFGWEDHWHPAGEISGTTGMQKRLEAIQIRLTGEMADHYDIYYCTHVQRFGWLGWAKNGERAGSAGYSFRMESLRICLVPKGASAPGSTTDAFKSLSPSGLTATGSANADNTITTFGGFALSTSLRTRLQNAIATAQSRGNRVNFFMVDIHTGQGVAYNPDEKCYSASTIKAPYVASVVFSDPSSIGKWESVMKSILQDSSNYAYDLLRKTYGSEPMRVWAAEAGITDESIWNSTYTWYSARELANLWLVNYAFFESGGTAATVGNWMQTPSRSAIRTVLGGRYTTRSKGGWKSSPTPCFNDAGIIYAANGPYVIALMSNYPGMNESGLYDIIEVLDACHATIS